MKKPNPAEVIGRMLALDGINCPTGCGGTIEFEIGNCSSCNGAGYLVRPVHPGGFENLTCPICDGNGAFIDGMVCSNSDCEVCFPDCEIELPISLNNLALHLQNK